MEGPAVENPAAPVVAPERAVEDAAGEDSVVPAVAPEAGSVDADQHIEDAAPEDGKHESTELNVDVTPEEMRSVIEVIADTGKFWHDWSFLKRLLSLQLKQVLAEYSEGQMVNQEDGQQQNSFSGATYSELVNQLNDALLRFEEGPPFTLQRLCEILLDPKGTYTKLSKLALALEKNLLVTSTITKCTDPYPTADVSNLEGTATTENTSAVDVEPERLLEHPAAVPNGNVGGDGDAEMADAEAEEPSSSYDVEMQEDKPDQISNVKPDASSDAAVTVETVDANEKSSDPQT
ncbi:serine/threonine-protein phosphatase 4 regulatory subunit 2 [Oryza brachyantha]|uniref:Serine/threonine-protein phosphatase 4 regulatory subunit 2 n=1 Tax=Oryza brachyantha TaxID=4533 RepID=J3MDG8_ORYBR|nr:serine/threonine-protein phosphatase 4 regulatory subunit 2 [Oryza brachyantha]